MPTSDSQKFDVTVKLTIYGRSQAHALGLVEERLSAGFEDPTRDPAALLVVETNIQRAKK